MYMLMACCAPTISLEYREEFLLNILCDLNDTR